ncbi:MAG: 3-dehydroquinate synthase [Propionibacteriaceae bacterium]|jgi:3-dehydroquinate synthase|nr:3-dehydroquinate synthase [Propionibacteriaceae bacterium]
MAEQLLQAAGATADPGLARGTPAKSERVVKVAAERPYDVVIGRGVSTRLNDVLGPAGRVAVIHPAALAGLARRVLAGRPAVYIAVPEAEAAKTPAVLGECWRRLAQAGFTRDDPIVGLGGGTTTDLAGFTAATWLRGVPHIAVPTTVLAMADASVGGKTGVDLPEGKNLVGAFWEPQAVLCDLDLLQTLPKAEKISGMAEIIKAGFIADPEITALATADPAAAQDVGGEVFAELLARAIAFKAAVVSRDLREAAPAAGPVGREGLNYGHTLAHAIEKASGYAWRHGEAVSVGMVFAAEVSVRLGLLDPAVAARQRRLLAAIGLPVAYAGADWATLRPAMALDKKARGASLRFVLLDGPQHLVIRADPPEAVLAAAFAALAPED